MKTITMIAAALVAVGLAGCDKLSHLDQAILSAVKGKMEEKVPVSPGADQIQNPVVSAIREATGGDPDRDLKEELNGYVACINRSQPRAEQSYARYLSWVSKAAGPNCNEPYITYGLYSLYDDSVEKCNQAAKRGAEGAPSLPDLEKAAGDLAKCNADLVPLVKKASDYYDQQDFKDDKCAKAKEMHPQLLSTFERCFAEAKILSDGADKLKTEADKREIAKLEQQGQSFRLNVLKLLVSARELLKTINTTGQGPIAAKNIYTPKCLEVEKNFQALDDYATAHKDEIDKTFWGSAFLSSAKEFNGAAKFLRRDLDEDKDPTSGAQAFVDRYNSMIGDSNNVRF